MNATVLTVPDVNDPQRPEMLATLIEAPYHPIPTVPYGMELRQVRLWTPRVRQTVWV